MVYDDDDDDDDDDNNDDDDDDDDTGQHISRHRSQHATHRKA